MHLASPTRRGRPYSKDADGNPGPTKKQKIRKVQTEDASALHHLIAELVEVGTKSLTSDTLTPPSLPHESDLILTPCHQPKLLQPRNDPPSPSPDPKPPLTPFTTTKQDRPTASCGHLIYPAYAKTSQSPRCPTCRMDLYLKICEILVGMS